MPARRSVQRGSGLPPVHLSDAVVAGGLIFLSGRVARDHRTARVVGHTVEEQTRIVLDSFDRALVEAGSSLDRIAKVTAFLVRREDFAEYDAAFAACFPKDPPAQTTVVAGLRPEGALIEMEAIACA